jgi:hypothetical protein
MQNLSAISWKRAAGLSCLAVYGPFIVVAIYALLFVPCSHCKATAWMLLPSSPGLAPIEVGRRWLGFSRLTDALWFTLAFVVSVFLVCLLAYLLRQRRWLRYLSMAVSVILFFTFAIGLLAAIRS